MNGFFAVVPILMILWFLFIVFIIIRRLKAAASSQPQNTPAEPGANTGEATVVDKRQVSNALPGREYLVLFEDNAGNRMELYANAEQFGQMVKGDKGILTFSGNSVVSFIRQSSAFNAQPKPDPEGEWHHCPACGATYQGSVCDYCGTPWQAAKEETDK